MKILYYREGDRLLPGIVTAEGILDVSHICNHGQLTIDDVQAIKAAIKKGNLPLVEGEPVIGPCVPRPQKIICIGLNYRKHAEESRMPVPKLPVVFTKYANTLIDYGTDVTLGPAGEEFDYEVELGVVIGKKCKNVQQKDALKYVLGYCVANDLSCRDLQFKTSQWLLGKSLDGFLPLGKYLVTADEVKDPQQLRLTCTLNGELRQDSNTSDMIFPVDEIIAFLSQHMTLEPGDLVLTGTPSGVIMGLPAKVWLKPGDIVKVEVEKLGFTENKMS